MPPARIPDIGRPLRAPNGDGHPNALFRNDAGRFTDVSAGAGVQNGLGNSGVIAGDIDSDGYPDLFLTGTGGIAGLENQHTPVRLYHNLGDGTFDDITASSGVVGTASSWSAAFADIDNDGFLDLFIGSAGSIGSRKQHRNMLYRNDGDLTFTDIGAASGVDTNLGACAAGFSDYDSDGLVDLFVTDCNDVSLARTPIELHRNLGGGKFENVTHAAGLSAGGYWMGLSFSDYDHDGDIDLFSTNWGPTDDGTPHALYRNDGGTFRNVAAQARVAHGPFGWGCSFADFDNDGYDDLVFAGSLPYIFGLIGPGKGNPGTLRMNRGDGTFQDANDRLGIELNSDFTTALATGDFDGDGFADIVIVRDVYEQRSSAPVLLRNTGNSSHWIEVRTAGVVSNRGGVGARVKVVAGDLIQLKEVRAGSGFLSMDSPWLGFGLAGHEVVDRIEVTWPSGIIDVAVNVPADQAIVFEEGTRPEGSLRLPGDCNSDGRLEISDGICLLGNLFLGTPEKLPCGDGSAADPANVTLLDSNGDGSLNLADAVSVFGYLFLGSAGPAGGGECAVISGCDAASACR